MNNVDRDPALNVQLITDYGGAAVAADGTTLAERALKILEEDREAHLDIVQELTDAIRRIKEDGV